MRKVIVAGLLLSLAVLGSLAVTRAEDDKARALTPAEALAEPEGSKEVVVRGTLKNAGSNYFTDRRLVLTDDNKQAAIDVQAWLPSTVAEPRGVTAAEPPESPPVQSDYLDKEVVLKGEVQTKPVKGRGVTKVFVVKSAEIVPK